MSSTPAGEATPRAKFGWAMFDWANQPFFTVITTFIFAPYFVSFVVADPVRGQELWGYTQAAAGLTVALFAPVLGAIADARGRRKPWIAFFLVPCVVGSALLWLAVPGADSGTILLTMIVAALATAAIEFAIVFNNAMLPSLVPEERLGGLSGFGWGLGYLGGLAALVIILAGFSLPAETWFGLDKAAHEHDRLVGPFCALWLVLFSLPLFRYTPDAAATGLGPRAAARQGLATLVSTLRRLDRYRNIALYLIARMIYYDGQSAIFAFGGIYAAGLFGWTMTELGIFGIVLIVFATAGSFLGGWLDDRIGSKRTIVFSLIGLIFGTLGVVSVGPGEVFFILPATMPSEGSGLFASQAEQVFMAVSIVVGLCGGPAQAASRTMMARLAPRSMTGEFFGLYALSGKATAFMAPLAVAMLTAAYASQRVGMAVILLFLVAGLALFLFVREERENP